MTEPNAKARRGGKRPGAGRKLVLLWKERLEVGAEADKRLRQAAEARQVAMVEARNERFSLPEKFARLEDIRARKIAQLRKQVPGLPDHLLRQQLRDSLMNNDDVEEAKLDTRDAVGELYSSDKIEISDHQLRYGLRRQVFATVAKEKSKDLRRTITPRMVKQCLEEYRALDARLHSTL
jgi:hypothetical protein